MHVHAPAHGLVWTPVPVCMGAGSQLCRQAALQHLHAAALHLWSAHAIYCRRCGWINTFFECGQSTCNCDADKLLQHYLGWEVVWAFTCSSRQASPCEAFVPLTKGSMTV